MGGGGQKNVKSYIISHYFCYLILIYISIHLRVYHIISATKSTVNMGRPKQKKKKSPFVDSR